MNSTEKKVSRRAMVGWVSALGVLTSAKALADICGGLTAKQPLGPFFPKDGTPVDLTVENPVGPIVLANDNDLTNVNGRPGVATGQVVYILGKVTAGIECRPVSKAAVVAWQASASGRYNHLSDSENHDFIHPKTGKTIRRTLDPFFQYWGRAVTNENGEYMFKTIVPGFYPANLAQKWYRPPHIHMEVMAPGQPKFVTQMYFAGAEIVDNAYIQELNEKDLLLQNDGLSAADKKGLVVDFDRSDDPKMADGLVGQFNMILK
jgi:protocatechuate 3,4-dioxygenase beta subunit